jgi:hypothetical protein
MGRFERFREGFKEGAAEVLGFSADLDRGRLSEELLREAGAASRMLARRAEDVDWQPYGASQAYFDPRRPSRETQVERAHNFYFNDPLMKRTVDLVTFFTFANGLAKPGYSENQDNTGIDEAIALGFINAFWANPMNRQLITKAKAQHEKSLELQLQGNIFFTLFWDDVAARNLVRQITSWFEEGMSAHEMPTSQLPSPLEVSDIPQQEIVDVIMHPGAKKVPVYYKRIFRPRSHNFTTDTWDYDDEEVVRYYRHWEHEAPTQFNGQPWGPPTNKIGQGVVYHLPINKTSEMKFGQTQLQSYMKWAAGLNEFMTARMSVMMAISQIALQAKTKGGPKQVQQVQGALADISRMAGDIEGLATTRRIPGEMGRTKAATSSGGVDLQPMVQDTNAAGAATDIQTMKGQIAAGSGVGTQHIGGEGASLAFTTSTDAPTYRIIESFQKLWEDMFVDTVSYGIKKLDLDPGRVEMKMPPILSRDFNLVATGLAAMLSSVDPGVFNRELVRFYVGEVLEAMGKKNVKALLDKFFPEDWIAPGDRAEALQKEMAGVQGGGSDTSATPTSTNQATQQAGAARQRAAGEAHDQAERGAAYYSRGTTRGLDQRDAGTEGRDRARANRDRQLEGAAVYLPEEIMAEDIQAVFREAFGEDVEQEEEAVA